jgi:hypothetical protein
LGETASTLAGAITLAVGAACCLLVPKAFQQAKEYAL